MRSLKAWIAAALLPFVAACMFVRQDDLNAWVGVPVEALDTHSFFITVPMYRTLTASGIEVRNYANARAVANCFGTAGAARTGNFVNGNTFNTCIGGRVVCNNIFYIRNGVVIEYAPTGRCYTNETVRPEARYLRLKSQ